MQYNICAHGFGCSVRYDLATDEFRAACVSLCTVMFAHLKTLKMIRRRLQEAIFGARFDLDSIFCVGLAATCNCDPKRSQQGSVYPIFTVAAAYRPSRPTSYSKGSMSMWWRSVRAAGDAAWQNLTIQKMACVLTLHNHKSSRPDTVDMAALRGYRSPRYAPFRRSVDCRLQPRLFRVLGFANASTSYIAQILS